MEGRASIVGGKMKTKRILINDIPAIIWGEQSEKIYIHVHGKLSRKEYADSFAEIAEKKGYQTLSFDLPEHGERAQSSYRCDIWNGMNDLASIADFAFLKWKEVSLFACSLGAYFSLNTYIDKPFEKCLFLSPMLDMEYMIRQMFEWYDVTEERLCKEKEISTPFDTLRWDYFQYVLNHPVSTWRIPTSILYGAKDNLQSIQIIQEFANTYKCELMVSENSEHPFMEADDVKIVANWLEANI